MSNYRRWLPLVALLATAIALIALPSGASASGSASQGSQPNSIGPCPVFPADNAWNTDISNYPLDPNSQNYINTINASRQYLHPDFGSNQTYGIPYVVVPGSQPFVPITFTAYGDQSDPGPYPVPLNAPVEGGPGATGDRHVLAVDTGNCMLYEMGNAFQVGAGWNADAGAIFN